MNTHIIIETIGYIGSALVILSMLMTSVVKLRIINSFGCIVFATYALLIHSYPTAAMQVCLIIINIINLRHLLNVKKEYSVFHTDIKKDSFIAQYFIKSNFGDIKKYFPDFELNAMNDSENIESYIICCGSTPVGLFVGTKESGGNLNVMLDYTTPAYRDCSVGKYLYAFLAGAGIKQLHSDGHCKAHIKYLRKMGIIEENNATKTFTKELLP